MKMTNKKSEKWTCEGSVCGECGHTHRSLDAALRCCAVHHRGCATQGGYSDRRPVRLDHGDGECCKCGAPIVWDDIDREWCCQAHPYTIGHGRAKDIAAEKIKIKKYEETGFGYWDN
jgi:hypothetical protein